MRRFLALGMVLLFSFSGAHGQDLKFQIGAFGDYITSARVYPAPRDADPSISSSYNGFGGFISFGADVRTVLTRSNTVGLTIQSLDLKQTVDIIHGYTPSGQYVGVPVQDGFRLWLLESNGYFSIPILEDRWNVYLGGGPALYLGKRNLEIGNAEANTPLTTAFGVQVAAGVAYKFANEWNLRAEMKFRSPEFNTTSTFSSASTNYQGLQIMLPGTQYGKVNVDGTNFTLGVFYEF